MLFLPVSLGVQRLGFMLHSARSKKERIQWVSRWLHKQQIWRVCKRSQARWIPREEEWLVFEKFWKHAEECHAEITIESKRWSDHSQWKCQRQRRRDLRSGDWPTLGTKGFIHLDKPIKGKWWTHGMGWRSQPLVQCLNQKGKKVARNSSQLSQIDVRCVELCFDMFFHFTCPAVLRVFRFFLKYIYIYILPGRYLGKRSFPRSVKVEWSVNPFLLWEGLRWEPHLRD